MFSINDVQSEQTIYYYCLQNAIQDLLIFKRQDRPQTERYDFAFIEQSFMKLSKDDKYFGDFEKTYFQQNLQSLSTTITNGNMPSLRCLFSSIALVFENVTQPDQWLQDEILTLIIGSLRFTLLKATINKSISPAKRQQLYALANQIKVKIDKKDYKELLRQATLFLTLEFEYNSLPLDSEDPIIRVKDVQLAFGGGGDITIDRGNREGGGNEPLNKFIRGNNEWIIKFQSNDLFCKDHTLGYIYIQHLLRHPRMEMPAEDLEKLASKQHEIIIDEAVDTLHEARFSKEKIYDDQALRDIRSRIEKLEEAISVI